MLLLELCLAIIWLAGVATGYVWGLAVSVKIHDNSMKTRVEDLYPKRGTDDAP